VSEQADEMIKLLREINAGIKSLVAAKSRPRGTGANWAGYGEAGPKPCITCRFRETCRAACADLDKWSNLSGLPARPGVAVFKGRAKR